MSRGCSATRAKKTTDRHFTQPPFQWTTTSARRMDSREVRSARSHRQKAIFNNPPAKAAIFYARCGQVPPVDPLYAAVTASVEAGY